MNSTNGSFYQNGLPISEAETGLGNVTPGVVAPNPASSSFYLSGTIYETLQNQDQLLALLLADSSLVAADLVAANIAAANAAASASSAAATLASSLKIANNLSDLASVPTALINLGLQNVTNTSDINKPVSTAQATADALVASNAAAATTALTGIVSSLATTTTASLALKAPLASPALTGVPVAPTASPGTATTQLATTAFVDAARVILVAVDALKAPLASPSFTGTVAMATPLGLTSGGTGDTGSAWTTFSPAPSSGTATFTVNSARYKTFGKTVFISVSFTVVTVGTGNAVFTFTLPVTPLSDGTLNGREANLTGKYVGVMISAGSASAAGDKSDASNIAVSEKYSVSGVYESA